MIRYIMTHNKNVRIRDLVVCCVAQMVQAKVGSPFFFAFALTF